LASETKEAEYLSELGQALHVLATRHGADGDSGKAVELAREAARQQQAARRAVPVNQRYRDRLRSHYALLVSLQLKQNDPEAAAALAREVARLGPDDLQLQNLAAQILEVCLTTAEKDTRLAEDRRREVARSYATRALDHVRLAVEAARKEAS